MDPAQIKDASPKDEPEISFSELINDCKSLERYNRFFDNEIRNIREEWLENELPQMTEGLPAARRVTSEDVDMIYYATLNQIHRLQSKANEIAGYRVKLRSGRNFQPAGSTSTSLSRLEVASADIKPDVPNEPENILGQPVNTTELQSEPLTRNSRHDYSTDDEEDLPDSGSSTDASCLTASKKKGKSKSDRDNPSPTTEEVETSDGEVSSPVGVKFQPRTKRSTTEKVPPRPRHKTQKRSKRRSSTRSSVPSDEGISLNLSSQSMEYPQHGIQEQASSPINDNVFGQAHATAEPVGEMQGNGQIELPINTEFPPIIVKVESQAHEDNCISNVSSLHWGPENPEVVDDEVPSTSSACYPANPETSNSWKSAFGYFCTSESEDSDSGYAFTGAGSHPMRMQNGVLVPETINPWKELLEQDPKLRQGAVEVVLIKLDPTIFKELREKKYINIIAIIANESNQNTGIQKNAKRKSQPQMSELDLAIKRLLKDSPVKGKKEKGITTAKAPRRGSRKLPPKPKDPGCETEERQSESEADDSASSDGSQAESDSFGASIEGNTNLRFRKVGPAGICSSSSSQSEANTETESDWEIESDEEQARKQILRARKKTSRRNNGNIAQNGQKPNVRYVTPKFGDLGKGNGELFSDDGSPDSTLEEDIPGPDGHGEVEPAEKDMKSDDDDVKRPQRRSRANALLSSGEEEDSEIEEIDFVRGKCGASSNYKRKLRKRPSFDKDKGKGEPAGKKHRIERDIPDDVDMEENVENMPMEPNSPGPLYVNPASTPVCIDLSDSENEVLNASQTPSSRISRRKNIRPIMDDSALAPETRRAEEEEEARQLRIQSNSNLAQNHDGVRGLILENQEEGNNPLIQVDKAFLAEFKDHQREGLSFMWVSCIESSKRLKETEGTGCILAHCMGLGKSAQALAFLHTALTHEVLGLKSALVVCPKNTLPNWDYEFNKWLGKVRVKIPIHRLWNDSEKTELDFKELKKWVEIGGLAIVHYDRIARYYSSVYPTPSTKRKIKASCTPEIIELVKRGLFEPGPDLAVFDEGHLLKNRNTQIYAAAQRVRTKRKVILTGTPMQNDLMEYYSTVSLIKPNLLGLPVEFLNRFANPIQNGGHVDSSAEDVAIMKMRSHQLHKKLSHVTQRVDYSVLQPFLKEKAEYTLYINLSDVQKELYKFYTSKLHREAKETDKEMKIPSYVFQTFSELSKICTHPSILLSKTARKRRASTHSNGSECGMSMRSSKSGGEESSSVASSDNDIDWLDPEGQSIEKRRVPCLFAEETEPDGSPKQWYKPFTEKTQYFDENNLELSGKLVLLMDILLACEKSREKVLVFSQYLTTLDLIEKVLKTLDTERANEQPGGAQQEGFDGVDRRRWRPNLEYYRLDGRTRTDDRRRCTESFNQGESNMAKVFLISTRAGGLGINLIGANRVVVFDPSWNPAQDLQSIFRIYRLGQTKSCYVYRLLSHGTLEEKVYNQQVKKLSTAGRVVDQHTIARHFVSHETSYMYLYDEDEPNGLHPNQQLPHDRLLADLLIKRSNWIYKYGEHDTLLANRLEEALTEEEIKKAELDNVAEEQTQKLRKAKKATEAPTVTDTSNNVKKKRGRKPKVVAQPTEPQAGSSESLQINSIRPPQSPELAFVQMLQKRFQEFHPSRSHLDYLKAVFNVRQAVKILATFRNDGFPTIKCVHEMMDNTLDQLIEEIKEDFGHELDWTTYLGRDGLSLDTILGVDPYPNDIDKFVPERFVNEEDLPLNLTFDQSDENTPHHSATSTAVTVSQKPPVTTGDGIRPT